MRSLQHVFNAWREYVRRLVLRVLNNAVSRLQNPDEVAFRQAFETHSYNACLRLAIDLEIFHTILAHGNRGATAEHLATRRGADVQLVVRIMRVVTAIGYAKEIAETTYGPTPLTESITKPTIEATFLHGSEHAAVVASRLAEYFKVMGYHNPTDGKNGPFQFALGTKLPFFEFIHNDPRKLKNFNTFQAGNRSTRKSWLEWFPVERVILSDLSMASNLKKPLLVDMGGGTGRDILAFMGKFPQSAGSLILQDLPRTIEGLSTMDKGVMPMAHDLFEAQPIIGAKAYYTHFLLHDFPDDKCRIMLQRTASAMTPGYSRLLLNETILPNTGCPAFYAAADITMMSVLAGMNRCESQWKALLESAGLQLVRFWYPNDATNREGIIEAIVSPALP